jgi:hypothetical protein
MNAFTKSIKEHTLLTLFTSAYLIPFVYLFVSRGDSEFIWYLLVVIGLFLFLLGTLPVSKFNTGILWTLSIWGLLHLSGGGVRIGGGVLYGLQLLPIYNAGGEFVILKYDQFIHAFGSGVSAYVVFHILKRYIINPYRFGVYAIAALAGIGFGVFNELIELLAVVFFQDTGVGGYINNMLDLVFNTIGAICTMTFVGWKNIERNITSNPQVK